MIKYCFSVSPSGELVCYKADNGLFKFTGKKAEILLQHVKDFSYYAFETTTRKLRHKNTDKVLEDYHFISNSHEVTYKDIDKLKENQNISINSHFKDLFTKIKCNIISKKKTEEEKKNFFKTAARRAKYTICSAVLATILTFTPSFSNIKLGKEMPIKKVETTNEDTTAINNDIKIEKEIDSITKAKVATSPTHTININDYSINKNNNEENVEKNTKIEKVDTHTETINTPINIPNTQVEELKKQQTKLDKELDLDYPIETNLTNEEDIEWDGDVLTACRGTVIGPSGGKETWYNLKMTKVVSNMRNMGFSEEEYPYYEREDGAKMLGDYVMVAAHLGVHPRGSLVETSLGMGLVCDTGEFAETNATQIDVATNWKRTKKL